MITISNLLLATSYVSVKIILSATSSAIPSMAIEAIICSAILIRVNMQRHYAIYAADVIYSRCYIQLSVVHDHGYTHLFLKLL